MQWLLVWTAGRQAHFRCYCCRPRSRWHLYCNQKPPTQFSAIDRTRPMVCTDADRSSKLKRTCQNCNARSHISGFRGLAEHVLCVANAPAGRAQAAVSTTVRWLPPAGEVRSKNATIWCVPRMRRTEEDPRYLAPVVHSLSARSGNLPASRIQF